MLFWFNILQQRDVVALPHEPLLKGMTGGKFCFYTSALMTALVADMFWGCPSFHPILKNTISHKHPLGLKGQLTRFWWSKVRERIHCHLTKNALAIPWDFIHYLMMTQFHTNAYYDKCHEWVASKRSNAKFTVTFFGHYLHYNSAIERANVTIYYTTFF